MSIEEPVEWKTVRIPAAAYYKLSELSSFLSILFGEKVPLSFAADMTIQTCYNQFHQAMVMAISNPTILEDMRKHTKGQIEQLVKLLEPLMKAEKSGAE